MTAYDIYKNFIIVFFSFFIYLKISNKSVFNVKSLLVGFLFILIFSIFSTGLMMFLLEPYKTTSLIVAFGFVLCATLKIDLLESISFTAMSFAVSYIIFLLSVSISAFVFILAFNIYSSSNVGSIILITSIQAIFVYVLYKIKFKIILKKDVILTGLIISGIALIIYSISREQGLSNRVFTLLFMGSILCAIGLFYWIKRESITVYNNKIQSIRTAKLQEETEQLREIHNYLQKVVHDDNKKLPAYQEVIENLLLKSDNPEIKKKAEEILGEFIGERNTRFLEASQELENEKALPSTGIGLVDGIFTHYYKICRSKGIEFDLITSGEMNGIREIIPQSKFESIVANLLDNAIIACEHSQNPHKSVFVHFILKNNCFELAVRDNGIAFKPETLELLGKQRVTTHSDTSGSGIGFMTVFEITRACKASVVITENTSFKTVAVWFDGKGEYWVKTEETLQT